MRPLSMPSDSTKLATETIVDSFGTDISEVIFYTRSPECLIDTILLSRLLFIKRVELRSRRTVRKSRATLLKGEGAVIIK